MKTLVIANNFLSDVTNNGKTFKYLLSRYQDSDVLWLYTTPLETDLEADIKKILLTSSGKAISVPTRENGPSIASQRRTLKRHPVISKLLRRPVLLKLLKIVRELIALFRSRSIINTIVDESSKFKVDKIIFVAGDYAFLHKAALTVSRELSAPLYVYVTDDYLFRYQKSGRIELRKGVFQNYLRRQYVRVVKQATEFRFISNKMRSVYSEYFALNGGLSFNASKPFMHFDKFDVIPVELGGKFSISYFGSLHSGRYSALIKFFDMASKFSSDFDHHIEINVYTNTVGLESTIRYAEKCTLAFIPPVSGLALEKAMLGSDVLAIIESDDPDDLQRTWLSFSTKVMEYLYLNKPIVAFGPLDNPSINELVVNGAAIHVRHPVDFNKLYNPDYMLSLRKGAEALRESLERENQLL